jgi:SAM-dependent methyltransferase
MIYIFCEIKLIMPSYLRFKSNDNLFSAAKNIFKTKGIRYFARSSFWYLIDRYFTEIYYNKLRSLETFQFQGKNYHYLFHRYCTTWKNERCAIIPIAWDIIQTYQKRGKNILEVGNVISHIYPVAHDVLDKYEIADGVINKDIVDFQPSKRYDLIISIVTMQHVGYNDYPRDPTKILKAMENLKKILTRDGIIVIVHGLGENKEMDELLRDNTLEFNQKFYLMKTSTFKWAEVKWEDVKNLTYDFSIPTARAVIIVVFEKNVNKQKLFK